MCLGKYFRHFLLLVALMVTTNCNRTDTEDTVIKKETILDDPIGAERNASLPLEPVELQSSFEAVPLEPDGLQLESSFQVVPEEPENITPITPEEVIIVEKPIEVTIVEQIPTQHRLEMPRLMTPLQEVGTPETPLVDKIIMIDSDVCGGYCHGSYPYNYRPPRWNMCQTCHCDAMCHFYRDCCPDVLLKQNVTYDETPRVVDCVVKKAVVYDPK
ncbi:hypothetical protein EGW08_020843 [Elysia chlorotica]|uniref:SMB domain-containing protein n=1 Tax=Elysia chlorotica TaxID=188477 RepID=A0A433SQ86_ELYCH|nr:hypothetical protein EGW08_020843 [Elysia chlorotica]